MIRRPPFSAADLAISLDVRRQCAELGLHVLVHGRPGYPARLLDDPEAPRHLYVKGAADVLDADTTLGIVGTRNATAFGRDTARRFGAELSSLGVSVVSGLAAGIDASAHEGAVGAAAAPPVAVVGSGLDIVYPRSNLRLFDAVARTGAVVSEHPPGTPAKAHHFPLRNRLIAALSNALLVVESRASGGSLITAMLAADRGRTVLALPGSINSPTAEGTNRLLRDGCTVVLDVDDVLVALSLAARQQQVLPFVRSPPRPQPSLRPVASGRADVAGHDAAGHDAAGHDAAGHDAAGHDARARSRRSTPAPLAHGGADAWLLSAVDDGAATIDEIAHATGRTLLDVLGALDRLGEAGLVLQEGPWLRRRPR